MAEWVGTRVSTALGLAPRATWPQEIPLVLAELSAQHRCAIHELVAQLHGDDALLWDVAARLTVGETHFFRHPAQLEALTGFLMQQLARPGHPAPVTVWSAGCSTGEEPYSVVMALTERAGVWPEGRVQVLATDINHVAIAAARQGVYRAWSFRGAPEGLRERYFQECSNAEWQVREDVRRRVEFVRSALGEHAAALAAHSVDVILFRNVAIYFQKDALDLLVRQLWRVLRPGGMLVLAPSDPAPPLSDWEYVVDAGVPMYRHRTVPAAPDVPARVRSGGPGPALAPRRGVAGTVKAAPLPRVFPVPARGNLGPPEAEGRRGVWQHAAGLADQGHTAQAIAAVTTAIAQHPTEPMGYLLRGQFHLDVRDATRAVEDLRRALFLDPRHCLARFWYAVALRAAQQVEEALRQLRELSRQLAGRPEHAALEDGETRSRALLEAVALMREELE